MDLRHQGRFRDTEHIDALQEHARERALSDRLDAGRKIQVDGTVEGIRSVRDRVRRIRKFLLPLIRKQVIPAIRIMPAAAVEGRRADGFDALFDGDGHHVGARLEGIVRDLFQRSRDDDIHQSGAREG